jgi:hypothetical protein
MQHDETDVKILEQNKILTIVNKFSLELASVPLGKDLHILIAKRLKEYTGALAVAFSEYDNETKTILVKHLESDSSVLNTVVKVLGHSPLEIKSKVSDGMYDNIIAETVGIRNSLTEVSFGEVPEAASKVINSLLNISGYIGMAYVIEGNLYGTSLLVMCKDVATPSLPMLEALSNVIAVSLRRNKVEADLLQSQKAQKFSEEKFQVIAHNLQDMIFMTDPKGVIIYISPASEHMFGYKPSEMMGKNFILFLDKGDIQKAINRFQLAMSGNKINESLVLHMVRRNGEVFYGELVSVNLTEDGHITGNIGIIRDVTDRQKNEEEINRLNADLELRVKKRTAELEAINKELESFSYSVSHDLRSPLRSIAGFGTMLLEDFGKDLSEEGQDYLRRIMNATNYMGQLIDDLLNLSRLHKAPLHPVELNISQLVKAEFDNLIEAEPDRKIKLTLQPDIVVKGDMNLVRDIVQNLVSNAWKFTSKQEISEIEFGTRLINDVEVCYLKDNGVGFDMKYYKKLFGPFQRLHSVHDFPGSGIGLASIKRIINKHSGDIWAEAVPEEGATFYFHFGE